MQLIYNTRLWLSILITIVLTAIVSYLSFLQFSSFQNSASLVAHTEEVISKVRTLEAVILKLVSTQRDLVLSKKKPLGLPALSKIVDAGLTPIRHLTSDNDRQQKNIDDIQVHLDILLAAIDKFSVTNAKNIVVSPEFAKLDGEIMTNIEDDCERMVDEERFLLGIRVDTYNKRGGLVSIIIIMVLIVVGIGVISSLIMLEAYAHKMIMSENRLEAALAGSRVGIWDVNDPANWAACEIYQSAQMLALLGYDKRHLRTLGDFLEKVHHDDASAVKGQLEKGKHGEAFTIVCRVACANGHYRWFDVRGKGTMVAGKVVRLAGSIIDVTDKKTVQIELERSNEELQQFAYVASHDLQEPLRMVTSFMDLLKTNYSGSLDDKAKQYIEFAVDGAIRMKTLITALLDYSRVTTQSMPYTIVDTNDIIQTVLDDLKVVIASKPVKITVDNLPPVYGDKIQIGQVFMNLITNSLKFSKPNSPIEISVSAINNPHFHIFTIKDNGIGINPKYFDKLFIVFQRLNGRRYPGSGIGLAVCRKIIQRHGGVIWAVPTNDGTTFSFTLPAVPL